MENTERNVQRRPNPRKRWKKKLRRFIRKYKPLARKYAPLAVVSLVLILFLFFVVGSVRRGDQYREEEKRASLAAQEEQQKQQILWNQEANELLAKAEALAAAYDYDAAIAMLDTFTGDIDDFNALVVTRERYVQTKETMVPWNNPSQIPNLSFHMLIAEPYRTFNHSGYGKSWKWNFITTSEFSKILQQLYDNGYVLVDMDDVITATETADGVAYEVNTLYLPEGKKPIMFTQTQVNYYTYMVDGDGDGLADRKGGGFASKLILDDTGKLTNEMVTKDGATLRGDYDFVPILESFIEQHPDFSYRGARAVLAVSGYDGLFGYRTDPETARKISQEYYDKELAALPAVLDALRAKGYKFGCYTYGNVAYGDMKVDQIKEDLASWKAEVTPLLGDVEYLVYAKNSDISTGTGLYSGEKYEVLKEAGFRYYLGFCESNAPWFVRTNEYIRQGRIVVTGNSLEKYPKMFEGLFETIPVLDSNR